MATEATPWPVHQHRVSWESNMRNGVCQFHAGLSPTFTIDDVDSVREQFERWERYMIREAQRGEGR